MIYLHKILPVFLSPIFLFSALVIFGTWKKWRVLCYVAVLGLCLLATPVISGSFFRLIEGYSVKRNVISMPEADAIVVLSGMLTNSPAENGTAQEWSDPDRFFGALELYKADKAKLLVFTRGKMPWTITEESEGDILRREAIQRNVPADSILLSVEVSNTREEAAAVRKLMSGKNTRIILVTSAFHMPRAKTVFEREGFTVFTYPVDFQVPNRKTTFMDFLPNAGALFLSDLAVRELIGRLYYKFSALS